MSIEQQFSDAGAVITKQPAKVDGNAFFVAQGRLILFAQLINDSKPTGNRLHVATYHAGECCAFENNIVENLLLTFGTDPETQVLTLSLDAFTKLNTGTSPLSTEFYRNVQENCIATNLEFDSQIDARTSMEHAGTESLITNLAAVIDMSETDTSNMTESTSDITQIICDSSEFGHILVSHSSPIFSIPVIVIFVNSISKPAMGVSLIIEIVKVLSIVFKSCKVRMTLKLSSQSCK